MYIAGDATQSMSNLVSAIWSVVCHKWWICFSRSNARWDIFRLGMICCNPGSSMKLRPHRLKYVWNGSAAESGHLEKPPMIRFSADWRYLRWQTLENIFSYTIYSHWWNNSKWRIVCHSLVLGLSASTCISIFHDWHPPSYHQIDISLIS